MDLSFLEVSALPPGIDDLAAIASSENFAMVRRLIDDYVSGSNAFSREGECLCAALSGAKVIAVCGINVDPYYDSPSIGRIRHLYVHPDFRRRGVGARLMELIERHGENHFATFQLFTASSTAARFYERLNYVPVQARWKVSHEKRVGGKGSADDKYQARS